MNIILLGAPGSGKGTQGELLEHTLHMPRLSVGARIRRLVAEQSPEGIEAESYMLKGEAIPARLYVQIVGTWLLSHRSGFVVDNLVRTYDQLEAFKQFQAIHHVSFDKVFLLIVSEAEARKRLMTRKSAKERPDETPEAIHRRFLTFYAHLGVISEYFRSFGVFEEVDAQRSVIKVHADIMSRLGRGEQR